MFIAAPQYEGPVIDFNSREKVGNMESRSSNSGSRPAVITLWVWVGGVFALYLSQFSDLIAPIISVLGL